MIPAQELLNTSPSRFVSDKIIDQNSELENLSSSVSDWDIGQCPCEHGFPSDGFNGAFILYLAMPYRPADALPADALPACRFRTPTDCSPGIQSAVLGIQL